MLLQDYYNLMDFLGKRGKPSEQACNYCQSSLGKLVLQLPCYSFYKEETRLFGFQIVKPEISLVIQLSAQSYEFQTKHTSMS